MRLESLEPRLLLTSDLWLTKLTPTGPAGRPFDALEIEFSKPVQEGTFTATDIAMNILGGGSITPAEPTRLADDRYQVSFAGLTGSNTYVLTVGPDILDADGVPMNQDRDATPGEAGEDAYQAGMVSNALSLSDGDLRLDDKDLVFYGINTSGISGAHQFRDVQVLAGARLNAAEPGLTLAQLQLDDGATLAVAGGSALNVTGSIEVEGNSTILCQGKNTAGQVAGQWAGMGVTIQAADLIVEAGSQITADGQGYATTLGPGGSQGSGASHGGRGTSGLATYGSAFTPLDPGSGGGAGESGSWSRGGGAIRLNVTGTVTLDGEISADGQNFGSYGGGAAGGSILVTSGTLQGAGRFTADGSTRNDKGGGGGRIAVYYETDGGFTGFAASTASSGGFGAENGTTGFFATSVPNHHLHVYQNFAFGQDSVVTLGALTHHSGTISIGGGSTLSVNGTMTVASGATVTALSKDRMGAADGQWAGVGATLTADTLTVPSGALITADGQGYTTGQGPGANGSHGGRGAGNSGPTYGSDTVPRDLGSGGSPGESGSWAFGGGAIRLNVRGTLTLDGEISADGRSGGSYSGGAAGGSVCVNAGAVAGTGRITADGTPGRGGGGGRIAVHYRDTMTLPGANITAAPGREEATAGTVVFRHDPLFVWQRPADPYVHGLERVEWDALGVDFTSHTVDVQATGPTTTLGTGLSAIGSIPWDTAAAPDGLVELRAVLKDGTGRTVAEIAQSLLRNNSVAWHSHWIAGAETWAADRVHVVEQPLAVVAGGHLTIDPGAVVKFVPGAKLTVHNGAILDAPATQAAPIVLTSLADDTVGGDTGHDGEQSRPYPGDWQGLTAIGAGALNLTEHVDIRYALASHSGTLGSSQTWDGSWVHVISDEVVVSAGVTLTIEPGAIVKFAAGKRLRVQAGGTLLASGAVAQPIYFTSLLDDQVGGDTNGDGNATQPAAGDWHQVLLDSGAATLRHVEMRYGGAAPGGSQAEMLLVQSGGSATVSESVLRDAFYDGLLVGTGEATVSNSLVTGMDRAIVAHPNSTVHVLNSTVDDNRLGLVIHGGTLDVANSLITNSLEAGIDFDFGTLSAVRYTDVWTAALGAVNYKDTADQSGSNHNISADPRYRDRARRNFRLDYRSPVIDAADGLAAPATDFMGAPRYNDPRTADTGVPMPGGDAIPDMGAYEFVETADSNVDLVVTSVVGPGTAVAGAQATVRWTITNLGTGAAVGPWHDSVYLDYGGQGILAKEVLVGVGVVLGSGESYTASAEVRVPGSVVANHRWQVTTNTRGEVFEGQKRENNTGLSAAPVALDLPELVVGAPPLNRSFSAADEPHWFKLNPASGQDVLIDLQLAANGVTELYIGRGYLPTPYESDFRHVEWNSADTTAIVPGAWPQTYYVVAYPESLGGGPVDFTIAATNKDFALDSVSPAIVDNSGQVTLALRGGRLGRDLAARVVGADGAGRQAAGLYWENPTLVYATFDLTGLAPGRYDVEATVPGAGVRELSDALEVVTGEPGDLLVANFLMPDRVRVGVPFGVRVEYQNQTLHDIVAPILEMETDIGISPHLQGDPDTGWAIAVSPTGPAGIVRPGQRAFADFQGTAATPGTKDYALFEYLSSNAVPIDWNELENLAKPPDTNPAKWAKTWPQFIADTGNTWGDFVKAIARSATRAGQLGQRTSDYLRLFQDAVLEAYRETHYNVAGYVYLGDDLHPLAGVYVHAYDAEHDTVGIARSEADGSFAMYQVAPGTYDLSVEGYVGAGLPQLVVGSERLEDVELTVVEGASMEGVIRTSAGRPIADASVSALDSMGQSRLARSDASGLYRMGGLAAGEYTLRVTHDSLPTFAAAQVQLAAGERRTGVDLVVYRPASVEGMVIDQDGEPVPGATVLLVGEQQTVSTQTTIAGYYSVGGLNPGSYFLSFEAAGYVSPAPRSIALTEGQTLSTPRVPNDTLVREARIVVVVTDGVTGAPIPDLGVYWGDGQAFQDATITDRDGGATIASLAAGTYDVGIRGSGYWHQIQTVTVAAGQTVSLPIAMHPAGSVSGRLLHSSTGAPVPNTTIQVVSSDGTAFSSVTDQDGQYRIANLREGQYAAGISSGGTTLGNTRRDFVVDVNTWEYSYDFQLGGGGVSGTVYGRDATPKAGAQVFLVYDGEVITSIDTTRDGYYCFLGLAEGVYQIEAIELDTAFTLVTVAVGLNEFRTGVNLTGGNLTLTGSVQEAAGGAPVAGASVSLTLLDPNRKLPSIATSVVQSAQSSFQVPGLLPGVYDVAVFADGFAIGRTQVTLSSDGANAVQVSLAPERRIMGTVRDAVTGQPVAGAAVILYRDGENFPVASGLSASDGTYTLPRLSDGVYDLLVRAESFQASRLSDIVVSGAHLTADLSLSASSTSLSGSVRDALGNPLIGASAVAKDALDRAVARGETEFDGRYRIDALPAGAYQVEFDAPGYAGSTLAVTLAAGEQRSEADVVLPLVAVPDWRYDEDDWREESPNDVFTESDKNRKRKEIPWTYNQEPWRVWEAPLPPQPPSKKVNARRYWDYLKWWQHEIIEAKYVAWLELHNSHKKQAQNGGYLLAAEVAIVTNDVLSLLKTTGKITKLTALEEFWDGALVTTQERQAFQSGWEFLVQSYTMILNAVQDWKNHTTTQDTTTNLINVFRSAVELLANGLLCFQDIGPLKAVPVVSDLLQLGIDLYGAVTDTINTYQGLKNTAEANDAAGDAYRKAAAMYNQKVDEYNKFYDSCDGTDQTPPLAPPPYGRTGSVTHQNTAEEAKDPNDKVTAGFSPAGWIAHQTPIPYVIHFENLAAAGLPAQRVVVTDMLDENLDLSTFELWEIGFNNTALRVPGGLQQYVTQVAVPTDPNPVEVEVAFDAATGGITWSMMSLDPATGGLVADPIAGFLPPNDATHRGEGWLTFAVRPKPGLAAGTEIRNRARIVFDVNAPIDTNETLNTIDADAPTALLAGLAPGATVKDWQLNARGYLDITFSDLGAGINKETILDSQAEFVLSGAGAAGVSVNGEATLVDGTANTYRYTFTGAFSDGPVSVEFAAGAFGDNVGHSNQAATESFTVQFEPSFWIDTPQPVQEGNKQQRTLSVPVRLTGAVARAVTVNYVTVNGTAIAGKDYKPVRGSLTFRPKKPLTQTIKVPILDDRLYENTETFQIKLSLPKQSKLPVPIAVGMAAGTILEGDPMPSVSIRDVSVREGNQGTAKATFVVTLSGKSSLTTTVAYATADGTATVADGDYRAADSTLTFGPGVTRRTITVLVNGDRKYETNETFQVTLSSPTNATLARSTGTGTIKNDDAAPKPSGVLVAETGVGVAAPIAPASIVGALDYRRYGGGTTRYDAKAAALAAVMQEWTAQKPFQDRCAKLDTGWEDLTAGFIQVKRRGKTNPKGTVIDDKVRDQLFGGEGDDWLLSFANNDGRDS